MVTSEIDAVRDRLLTIEACCEGKDYRRAFDLVRKVERESLPALRQAIKELAAPTIDYEQHVRTVVAREEKYGRGASLTYSFRVYDDERWDSALLRETIDRLVAQGEFAIKNQQVYTPAFWERVKARRAADRRKGERWP